MKNGVDTFVEAPAAGLVESAADADLLIDLDLNAAWGEIDFDLDSVLASAEASVEASICAAPEHQHVLGPATTDMTAVEDAPMHHTSTITSAGAQVSGVPVGAPLNRGSPPLSPQRPLKRQSCSGVRPIPAGRRVAQRASLSACAPQSATRVVVRVTRDARPLQSALKSASASRPKFVARRRHSPVLPPSQQDSSSTTPAPRHVSFTSDTKPHDGVAPVNACFDQLIWDYFNGNSVATREHIRKLHAAGPEMGRRIAYMLQNFAERILASPKGSAPVLPGGGGTSARLSREHVPAMMTLQGIVLEVVVGVSPSDAARVTAPAVVRAEEEAAADLDMLAQAAARARQAALVDVTA